MSVSNLFGLPRYVDTDEKWLWFLDAENYRTVLQEFDLSEQAYVQAWGEVLNVFSLQWARRTAKVENGYVGWQGIHPHPFGWLSFHPIAQFLCQKPYGGWQQAAPVLRLGLDLLRTKEISRVQSLRSDLRSLEQYSGRLFELEALSEFGRRNLRPEIIGTPDFRIFDAECAIYLEARHRGVPFWMEVARQVRSPLDRALHCCIRIDIKFTSGVRADASLLASEINQDLGVFTTQGPETAEAIDRPKYAIRSVPEGQPGTMVIGYGPDQPWSVEIERIVFQTLADKSEQLRTVATSGHTSALLMDCRSLLPPQMPDPTDTRNVRRDPIKAGILRAGQSFLDQYPWVSGVIWWWKLAEWPISLRDLVHRPWLVSLSTRDGHRETFDPAYLRTN